MACGRGAHRAPAAASAEDPLQLVPAALALLPLDRRVRGRRRVGRIGDPLAMIVTGLGRVLRPRILLWLIVWGHLRRVPDGRTVMHRIVLPAEFPRSDLQSTGPWKTPTSSTTSAGSCPAWSRTGVRAKS